MRKPRAPAPNTHPGANHLSPLPGPPPCSTPPRFSPGLYPKPLLPLLPLLPTTAHSQNKTAVILSSYITSLWSNPSVAFDLRRSESKALPTARKDVPVLFLDPSFFVSDSSPTLSSHSLLLTHNSTHSYTHTLLLTLLGVGRGPKYYLEAFASFFPVYSDNSSSRYLEISLSPLLMSLFKCHLRLSPTTIFKILTLHQDFLYLPPPFYLSSECLSPFNILHILLSA